MGKATTEFLTSCYSNSTFEIQCKARALRYVNLIFLILLPVATVALNAIQRKGIFAPMNFVLAGIFASFLASTVLLARGRYHASANIVGTLCTAGLVALVFLNIRYRTVDFMTNFFYASPAIVFTSIFCRIPWVVGLSVLWLGASVGSYVIARPGFDPVQLQIATGIAPDAAFSIILCFVISLMLVSLNKKINRKVEESAEENMKQFESLSRLLGTVRTSAGMVASSSDAISGASRTFSDNAQVQAATVEEVTSTIEEVTAGTEQIADRITSQTESILNLMRRLKQLTESLRIAGGQVDQSASHVNGIARTGRSGEDALGAMNVTMTRIYQSSNDMNGIIGIINDIADQINLLSLNASIEAARAGDSGRGFAVVADEISKLADRTSTSTKDISKLIQANEKEISSGMIQIAGIMKILRDIASGVIAATGNMRSITAAMDEQLKAAEDVLGEAGLLTAISGEIREASDEQKSAIIEIMKAVSAINTVAQDYANGARGLAESSVSLASMADEMRSMVR